MAIAGCQGGVPLGAIAGVPLRGKIDQSVTPFSAAPFSILITHKLACAIWDLCWHYFFDILSSEWGAYCLDFSLCL